MDSSLHFMKAFVFSDIVASTRLKNSLPGHTQADRDRLFIDSILEPHRKLLESSLEEHKGRLVKTLGDGCFVVFDSPVKAALWAMDVQSSHHDTPIVLPDGQTVGVKIGIHHGEATLDPQDVNDYSGRNVDYAARLVELATRGRIIVSRSMYAQLEDAGIYGVEFHDHGERELRGIGHKSVYELLWGDLKPRPLKGDAPTSKGDQPPSDGAPAPDSKPSQGEAPTQAGTAGSLITKVATGSSIGPYVLGRRLGQGAMGTVYKAEHSGMHQVFAIKVIDDSLLSESEQPMVSRFYREIKAIAKLNHPNVVRAHNSSLRSDPIHYLVMEFLDGLSLDQVISTKPVNWQVATEIIRRATIGLDYIHQNELVHRDIKPSNLLVTYPGSGTESEIKILDLGLALLLDEDERETRVHNSIMGSAYYMSPEQWQSSEVDIRADIYSLGCTFYHLLTGRAPFQDSPYNQKYAHENLPVPALDESLEVPESVVEIVDQMLAKSPDDRYTTPEVLLEAIEGKSPRLSLSNWAHSFTDAATRSHISTAKHGDTIHDIAVGGKKAGSLVRRSVDALADFCAARPRTVMAMTVAVMAMIFAGWLADRMGWIELNGGRSTADAQRRELLADELGTLTNLYGTPAVSGDWWFDQAPWFTPAIRSRLATEFENPDQQDEEIESLLARIDEDFEAGHMRQVMTGIKRVRERRIMSWLNGRPEFDVAEALSTSEGKKGKILISKLLFVEQKLKDSTDPMEVHLRAVVRHKLSLEVKGFMSGSDDPDARRMELEVYLSDGNQSVELLDADEYRVSASLDYEKAINGYKSTPEYQNNDRLRALVLTDYARFLFAHRDRREALNQIQQALRQDCMENALISRVALKCTHAYMYRKNKEPGTAIRRLKEARQEIENNPRSETIPKHHPLRVAIDERMGWAYFDAWELDEARKHFESFIAAMDQQIRRSDDSTQLTDYRIYRIHAEMGRLMVMHYSGNQQGATDGYEETFRRDLQDRPGLERRSMNFIDRQADAWIFGPDPQPENAVRLFYQYQPYQRDYWVPSSALAFKDYRMAIALAMDGQIDQARDKLAELSATEVAGNEQVDTARLIAELLCDSENDVDPLLRHVRQLVINDYSSEAVKPHPHLTQLFLLATESIITRCEDDASLDDLNQIVSVLRSLVRLIEPQDDPLNPMFERYLQIADTHLKATREKADPNHAEVLELDQHIQWLETMLQ